MVKKISIVLILLLLIPLVMAQLKLVPKPIPAKELVTSKYNAKSVIVKYSITITTDKQRNSGTDANVYIEIFGKSTLLDKPKYNDFERGDIDTYTFSLTRMTLDSLRKTQIRLWHNNAGNKPGWCVARVVLKVLFEKTNNYITYKSWGGIGWLAKDEEDWDTEHILQEGVETEPPA